MGLAVAIDTILFTDDAPAQNEGLFACFRVLRGASRQRDRTWQRVKLSLDFDNRQIRPAVADHVVFVLWVKMVLFSLKQVLSTFFQLFKKQVSILFTLVGHSTAD